MAHDVFISYATSDAADTATSICKALEESGARCWIAPRNIRGGENWPSHIPDAIHDAAVLLVILTEGSTKSKNVINEITLAAKDGKPVIPYRVQPVELSRPLDFLLAATQVIDAFPGPPERHMPKLLEAVFGHLGRSPSNLSGKEASPTTGVTTIGIVGLGFAGTVTAIRLLELATRPLNLLLIYSQDYTKHGGLAYGDSSCGWEHLLNIQAGRISLYRERPTDFLDWVNSPSEADKSTWPREWQFKAFVASSAVPRRVYGQYLEYRFKKVQEKAKALVSVVELVATVEDIQERTHLVEVRLRNSEQVTRTITCDRVVLATGHDRPVVPRCMEAHRPHSNIIDTPYTEHFADTIAGLSPDRSVLILGTGLTAYDAILTIHRSGFKGRVVMVPGMLHAKPYPGDHIHDILPLPLPPVGPNSSLRTR